jgi:hypothetical protein
MQSPGCGQSSTHRQAANRRMMGPTPTRAGGRCFEDCTQAVPYKGGAERVGVGDYDLDADAAVQLWELSA